ncbi:MAG: hypothetical protein MJ231_02965 [bacterium]|nr:hypothetical protein [bacterium]
MRKFLSLLVVFILSAAMSFAAKMPQEVVDYVNKTVPGTDIRFDGVVILPDGTIYLPLFPSLFSDIKTLNVKQSFPEHKELKDKPDIIIFNNDFVMMKVISDNAGHKTVLHQTTPPIQVRTGLLPQDMLVPSGLIIPENIKGIIGNLKIDTKSEDIIKRTQKESFEEFIDPVKSSANQTVLPQIKDKVIYVTTNYSKNIQVLEPGKVLSTYSLAQKSIPICVKSVNDGEFLLVTSFERPFLDVVSIADSRFIKQIDLSAFPEEILIDEENSVAYVTAPIANTIFVIDLKTMSLIKKIKINGYCEKLKLSDGKIFYSDKMKNEVWVIDTQNMYQLRSLGVFPNVTAIEFINGKVYITSRTRSRIAVIDYETLELMDEYSTVNKPMAMQVYGDTLYVLGAQNNEIQKINTVSNKVVGTISLDTDGFSTVFHRIKGTNLSVIADVKKNKYSIFDLSTGKILRTYEISVPIKDVIITDKVKLFK